MIITSPLPSDGSTYLNNQTSASIMEKRSRGSMSHTVCRKRLTIPCHALPPKDALSAFLASRLRYSWCVTSLAFRTNWSQKVLGINDELRALRKENGRTDLRRPCGQDTPEFVDHTPRKLQKGIQRITR